MKNSDIKKLERQNRKSIFKQIAEEWKMLWCDHEWKTNKDRWQKGLYGGWRYSHTYFEGSEGKALQCIICGKEKNIKEPYYSQIVESDEELLSNG